MSEEQLKAFLEKVKADTSLQEKLKAAASPEAALEIAKDGGFSITAEDIQSTQSDTVELSEEQLERATGGNLTGSVACYLEWGANEPRQVSPIPKASLPN